MDRPVDVRLGREVHDDLRRARRAAPRPRVGDVAVHERVPRVIHHVVQVLQPSGVGQLVERRDAPVGVRGERVAHEVAADEPGAAGDEDFDHDLVLTVASR